MNIIINPFIISLIISSIIIAFLPPVFSKYSIELVKRTIYSNTQQYYHDIDHDSFDESILLTYEYDSFEFPCIKLKEETSERDKIKEVNQYNWEKQWLSENYLMFGDYNFDNSDEIYVYTHSDDSLFLMGLDPGGSQYILFEKFIANVSFKGHAKDFSISNGGLFDLNEDGYQEVVFTIAAGFSLEPRALYAYDIQNDTLISKNLSFAFADNPRMAYDSSIGAVLVLSTTTPENYANPPGGYYSDGSSWLFAFNNKLEYLFPPIEQKRKKSTIVTIPKLEDSVVFIYAVFNSQITNDSSYLRKYSTNGKLLFEFSFSGKKTSTLFSLLTKEGEKIYLYNPMENNIIEIKRDLSIGERITINKQLSINHQLDIDNDGLNELLCYDPDFKKNIIYRNNFSHPLEIHPAYPYTFHNASEISMEGGFANLHIQTDNQGFYYKYAGNPLYYFKYLIYTGIYILITLFLFFILKIQKNRLQKKFRQESRMTELELATIKNQVEPHFIFNIINSISSMVYEKDRKTARQSLLDFSKLIRASLLNAKKIEVSLKEELEVVVSYLKLEQARYRNKIDFRISKGQDIDPTIKIPKMIIQTFTENAVKHGLARKDSGGSIEIRITNKQNELQITIEDNGIGRAMAKEVNKGSTRKGMEIVDQIIDLYKKLYNSSVSYKFEDLFDENGSARGTRVTINIPTIDKKTWKDKSHFG